MVSMKKPISLQDILNLEKKLDAAEYSDGAAFNAAVNAATKESKMKYEIQKDGVSMLNVPQYTSIADAWFALGNIVGQHRPPQVGDILFSSLDKYQIVVVPDSDEFTDDTSIYEELTISDLQDMAHADGCTKGKWDGVDLGDPVQMGHVLPEKIALLHSIASEAFSGLCKNGPDFFDRVAGACNPDIGHDGLWGTSELSLVLADLIIAAADITEAIGDSLEEAIAYRLKK